MRIMVDDPTRPMSPLLSVGLAYLVGIGVVGYMAIWMWISQRSARARWPKWLTQLALGLHGLLGLSAFTVVVPIMLHRLKPQMATSTGIGIAFALTCFVLICLGALMARDLSGWFRSQESDARRNDGDGNSSGTSLDSAR